MLVEVVAAVLRDRARERELAIPLEAPRALELFIREPLDERERPIGDALELRPDVVERAAGPLGRRPPVEIIDAGVIGPGVGMLLVEHPEEQLYPADAVAEHLPHRPLADHGRIGAHPADLPEEVRAAAADPVRSLRARHRANVSTGAPSETS